jgi:hypothetical protein
MSAVVSTFLDVELGKGKYLFFLVAWDDYETAIREQLDKQWLPFGADLGVDGTAIRAYDQMIKSTWDEVQKKEWPDPIRERMESEQDPYMLIIDRKFEEFTPMEHRWSIVWFSEFMSKPESIYRFFGSLAKKVKVGEDIFEWTAAVARKQKYSKIAKYFSIKPGIFGASVDVKAALEDLAAVK